VAGGGGGGGASSSTSSGGGTTRAVGCQFVRDRAMPPSTYNITLATLLVSSTCVHEGGAPPNTIAAGLPVRNARWVRERAALDGGDSGPLSVSAEAVTVIAA
jgi:hypothetical protein